MTVTVESHVLPSQPYGARTKAVEKQTGRGRAASKGREVGTRASESPNGGGLLDKSRQQLRLDGIAKHVVAKTALRLDGIAEHVVAKTTTGFSQNCFWTIFLLSVGRCIVDCCRVFME